MNFFDRFFGKKNKTGHPTESGKKQEMQGGKDSATIEEKDKEAEEKSIFQIDKNQAFRKETSGLPLSENRSIRVFVSSTFCDMIEDRNELMTHCWPMLRIFCAERHVELTEVDLRWGISEEQSTRKETLKLCLDEIRACRPFFIGLLGERYGWVPGDDAFTADLKQEEPWLKEIHGKSVTELEILHGVLNNPEMAGRAFFYFRDPAYVKDKGKDFHSENKESEDKQTILKNLILKTCKEKEIPLLENYSNPVELASLVLEQLEAAIEIQFPVQDIPDQLDREALDHEAFAEIRRRTYISRTDYYEALDNHCYGDSTPLLLLGDSGSGKSALFANWVARWREKHPKDYIFQHYIGSTSDSSHHWKLMTRLMKEIKRWTEDNEELPKTNDDILRDFRVWLTKARIKAEHDGIRFIIILDALNQLDDTDHGRILGWLPEHPFTGALRLIASTLPGETLEVIKKRNWQTLPIQLLSSDERRRMIIDYLKRYRKELDESRLEQLSKAPALANPLYLKILLDELRVTGTHDKLDERLSGYLAAPSIPRLLEKVLKRYQEDYDRDRPGLVREALGLIWSARRGLTENELLKLLKPAEYSQLPLAIWAPLRAALEEGLINRGGILNFAHDFLRTAVEAAFLPNLDKQDDFRILLAGFFEDQPPAMRFCDELPWLLKQTGLFDRLRKCLLNIDNFLLIFDRDRDELRQYWVDMGDEKYIGGPYLDSFNTWADKPELTDTRISFAANQLAGFLYSYLALYKEAEPLMEFALKIDEKSYGPEHPMVAAGLNNLAELLQVTNRLKDAEPLLVRSLNINEKNYGHDHPLVAKVLNNLSWLLRTINRLKEAELILERALKIHEKSYGPDHPEVATDLNDLAQMLQATNRLEEAEPLMERVLKIDEKNYGPDHHTVGRDLNNLALLLYNTNRLKEAEPLYERALKIDEKSYGPDHPEVATVLNNLAGLLKATNRMNEAEPLMERALKIDEKSYGPDHPDVATDLNNLAGLLKATNRLKEAEPLYERAQKIIEKSYGSDHPMVATSLNNLAMLLRDTNRLEEAEPLLERALKINENNYGPDHPEVATDLNDLAQILQATKRLKEAEPLMERLLKIDEKNYGPDHYTVGRDLNNLALLLYHTNRLMEAEPLYERALNIYENSYGPDHSQVATVLNNLAELLKALDRMKEAEPLLERALKIDEKSYGPDHPIVATTLNNLAQLLYATNRMGEAEYLMKRALKIDEKSYGPDHPEVAIDLNNLAQLLHVTNRLIEAEPLYERALKIDEKSYGPEHPTVAKTLNNLAQLLYLTNRIKEAEPIIERALKINEKSFGPDHPEVAITLSNLAGLLKDTNRLKEAEALLKRALKIDEKNYGPDHTDVAIRLNNIAVLLKDSMRLEEAEPLARRAVDILYHLSQATGDQHPYLETFYDNYIDILQAMGWSAEQIRNQLRIIGLI